MPPEDAAGANAGAGAAPAAGAAAAGAAAALGLSFRDNFFSPAIIDSPSRLFLFGQMILLAK
jgi:hypothetical protein